MSLTHNRLLGMTVMVTRVRLLGFLCTIDGTQRA